MTTREAEKAVERAMTATPAWIILDVEGGVIHDVRMSDGSEIPLPIKVRDYDTDGVDPAKVLEDDDGQSYHTYEI